MNAMPVHKFNFKSNEYRNDPWNAFGNLLNQGPLVRISMPIMGTSWAATNYEAVSAVLKSDEKFVRNPINAGRKTFIRFQWMLPRVFFSLIHNMLGADGVDHRRLRSVVDQAFARRNIEGMNDRIQAMTTEHLEEMDAAVDSEGKVDLVQHFARPLPLSVICELLGLPREDRSKFRKWFEPFSTVNSLWGIFSLGKGMRKVVKYFKSQIELVRKNPRDGLLSELTQIEHEGERLNESELLSMAFLLLVAGHETTVHLITNAILTLFQEPTVKDELLSDWNKTDTMIEEVLRYCSPLQMAKPRYVANDMEFYGQKLKQGELITPMIACANYDSAKFENPNKFDINRNPNYHMTFGSGPHTCLGMKLARSETKFALKGLFEKWPNLSPAFEPTNPDWSSRPATRGMKSLWVNTAS